MGGEGWLMEGYEGYELGQAFVVCGRLFPVSMNRIQVK